MQTEEDIAAPGSGVGSQARALLRLGLPLAGSHVAQMAIVTTDLVMIGWYDIPSLAALSLSDPVFYILFIIGTGFAWAVMPMVASAAGQGDDRQIRRVTRMGLWLSLLYGIAVIPPFFFFEPIFLAIGQDPEVSRLAGLYMPFLGLGIIPVLLVMVLKSYFSALEMPRLILTVTILGAVLNVVLNYILIFGHFGMPELGIVGAGIASLLGNVLAALAMVFLAAVKRPDHALFRNFWRPDWDSFHAVFRLGWPIGLTSLAEVGLFSASSILMGWLGMIPLAAHGVALQITALTFMVHMGLSQAVTVRVGLALGRGDRTSVRTISMAGMMLSMGMVAATITLFLSVPETLIGLFIDPNDPERPLILAVGASLLAVAALFQFVDASQAMALGMLRGVQDTHIPMVIATVSYWIIGVPTSYVLGFPLGMGGIGVWLGLCVGLACAGIFLQHRFWSRHV